MIIRALNCVIFTTADDLLSTGFVGLGDFRIALQNKRKWLHRNNVEKQGHIGLESWNPEGKTGCWVGCIASLAPVLYKRSFQSWETDKSWCE